MLAGLVALLPMASPANGQFQITQTETFSGIPSFLRTLTFDYFDPCAERQCILPPLDQREPGVFYGAVLDSVEITLSMSIHDGFHHVDNDGETGASPTVRLGANALLQNTPGPLLIPSVSLDVLNLKTFDDPCLAPDNGDGVGVFDSSGPDGAQFFGDPCKADTITKVMAPYNPVVLSFIGTGMFDLDVKTTSIADMINGGGVSGQYAPVTVDGVVEIVYKYHCVPEPATVGLLCLGAGALLRRRRRRL
jgi:hypothetical protein